ncbi:MAG: MMPL family transporter, partial [Bacteroidetes bacterium]|nr:MMPL family transporter [Bacteroidota bacterium]
MKAVINRKTLIGMAFIGLTLLGVVSYQNLSVELFPNAVAPQLIVQITSQLEVDPSYMERQAVIPVEGAIGTLDGIEEMSSNASRRRGIVYISYQQDVDIKYAELKLQEKMNEIRDDLPDQFMLTVVKVDLEQMANQVMGLEVRGTGGINRVRNIADEEIVEKLENIDGIAGVEVYGGQEKSLEITLDEDACEAYGITPFQVRNAINQNGRLKTLAGSVLDGQKKLFVQITAEYVKLSDIETLVVSENGPILLHDVGEVYFGVKEETSFSRVNGQEAITVSLISDSQANLIDLSHDVAKVVEQLNSELAVLGIEVVVKENMAELMEKNINQIINLALTGGLLAILILWIFLRNVRLVFAIALAIPISVYTAFNFFYAADISINSLTLVGMALAIGMLLDNSVVVLENIYRHASLGKKPAEAVLQGTREVWRSIVAATLTTITVFLPFIFSDNFLIRIMGNHIGVSIISTLVVSLFVALLFIPMLTHGFMSRRREKKQVVYEKVSLHNRLIQIYVVVLKASMRKPALTVIGALVVFFLTIFIALAISTNTLQEAETDEIRLSVTMPGGSTLETTDLAVRTIEERLMDVLEREDLTAEVREGEATLTMKLLEDYQDIDGRSLPGIKEDMQLRLDNIRSAEIDFQEFSASSGFSGGGGGGPGGGGGGNAGGGFESFLGIGSQQEMVIIKGQDFDMMRNVAEDLEYFLDELDNISSVNLSIADNRPEVHLRFNTREMGERNVPLTNVTSELSSFPSEINSGAVFKDGTEEYDIIIKMEVPEDDEERTMDELKELKVPSSGQQATYDLQELGDVYFSRGLSDIDRVNREKQIEVTYRFENEVNDSKALLDAARIEIDELVASLSIPSGVAVEVQHEENDFKEFYFLIAAAFILIFMILASVFESFVTPVVLMFTIPLAGIGSFLALIFTGNSLLNANTLTGFLILLGVVVNNGIILIDYTNILRKRGYRRSRALLTAGLARIRPIMITAVTTIVAMLPLGMGKSEYVSLIGAPFAITVIGGLSVSTILTLVFVPTLYSGLENSLEWIRNQRWLTKIFMAVSVIGLGLVIYFNVDAFLWKLVLFMLVVVGIPASTWFVMNSLRKASSKAIPDETDIVIRIQNLVKIYDRDTKFSREWKSGLEIRKRLGLTRTYESVKDLAILIWQLPLIGFLIFFVYFYLDSKMWLFFLSLFVYGTLLAVWQPIGSWIGKSGGRKLKLATLFRRLILWGFPVFSVILFHKRWDNLALEILIAVVWLFGLIVYSTAKILKEKQVVVSRIKGRFGLLRRGFFRMVQSIPLIGKQKKPFKALAAVSMEISSGMFGLLGPNGAGKTTMMRIICGILEQSYGKIWISGVDTQEKREELQGLIGYLPQEFGMYENMTAGEYLHYQGILKGLTDPKLRSERVEYTLKAVHMIEKKD